MLLGTVQAAAIATLAIRLRYLQVDQAAEFKLLADENSIKIRLLPPARGLILERGGHVIAGNEQNYRITITREDAGDTDMVLDRIARLVAFEPGKIDDVRAEIARRSPTLPITVADRLDWQEFSRVAGRPVTVTFTPHLLPQNRGILATIYLRGEAEAIHAALASAYEAEPFVVVLPLGEAPATRHVRGSNFVHLGVIADRRPGRAMVFSTLDNLAKGSSGQALQNANLMLGLPETAGLMAAPLFP